MGAIVSVRISADTFDDLAETVGEQVIAASARHWDTSTVTLLRVLAWLRRETGDPHLTAQIK